MLLMQTLSSRPLFSDTSAKPGVKYSYRVYAKNNSGISKPSEFVGPAKAPCRILIDKLANDSLMKNISAGVKFLPGWDATRAKEDKTRIEGSADDYLIYLLPKEITAVQADAFFTTSDLENNLTFFSGSSTQTLTPINGDREILEVFKNDYRMYCPVRYKINNIPGDHRYIRINLAKGIQIGHIEIGYDPE